MRYRNLRIALSIICGIAFVYMLFFFIALIEFALTFKSNPPLRPFNALAVSFMITGSLFAMTIASARPWLHWPPRFSIRTLVIVTTILAVGLGLAGYALRK